MINLETELQSFVNHILQRRKLGELVRQSDSVYARVFGEKTSETVRVEGGVFGIDGMFGNYVEQGGVVDIIGLNKNKEEIGILRL